jgi:hypothetical protein
VIIYGGTSSAVVAAVQVIKMGKSVIIVSPDTHLGGLSSGGLGFTDTGNKSVIGGLSREFYHRIYQHYQNIDAWKWQKLSEFGNKGQGTPAIDGKERTMWLFEPHVAEAIFEQFIKENSIRVFRNEWLERKTGVSVSQKTIKHFKTLSGKKFIGKMFIDATYDGDLMAAADIDYHVGREANSMYNETFNGVQKEVFHHEHHFKKDIDPYIVPGKPSSGLLPNISISSPGTNGDGDNKIQAYCFRMCLTDRTENRIAFPKPKGYAPKQYALLARVYNAGYTETFNKFDKLPNRKTDTNNHGPFSSDYLGMNYEYPEASYKKRKKIIKAHENYQKGLMYFIANDPQIPQEVRKEMSQWGLSKDEFKDNGNWPHQIYVREARRMIGEYVMTENDVLNKREVPKSVGMGSYAMDSHNTQRYVKADGFVQNEGDIGVEPDKPYRISYSSIVPKKEECVNLLVPVCVSSSHISYGSIRMEPVFMILGQSAAAAACIAIDDKISVQDVAYKTLKEKLVSRKQVLSLLPDK